MMKGKRSKFDQLFIRFVLFIGFGIGGHGLLTSCEGKLFGRGRAQIAHLTQGGVPGEGTLKESVGDAAVESKVGSGASGGNVDGGAGRHKVGGGVSGGNVDGGAGRHDVGAGASGGNVDRGAGRHDVGAGASGGNVDRGAGRHDVGAGAGREQGPRGPVRGRIGKPTKTQVDSDVVQFVTVARLTDKHAEELQLLVDKNEADKASNLSRFLPQQDIYPDLNTTKERLHTHGSLDEVTTLFWHKIFLFGEARLSLFLYSWLSKHYCIWLNYGIFGRYTSGETKLIGVITAHSVDYYKSGSADLSIWVDRDVRGQHVATRGLVHFLNYVFGQYHGIECVNIITETENVAMQGVARRLGAMDLTQGAQSPGQGCWGYVRWPYGALGEQKTKAYTLTREKFYNMRKPLLERYETGSYSLTSEQFDGIRRASFGQCPPPQGLFLTRGQVNAILELLKQTKARE